MTGENIDAKKSKKKKKYSSKFKYIEMSKTVVFSKWLTVM